MGSCATGIPQNYNSQLTGGDLTGLIRDATQFFGQRTAPKRFRSASEAMAYRKMLAIAGGTNGPRPPASSIIAQLQTAVDCSGASVRSIPVSVVRSIIPAVVIEEEEGADVVVEENEPDFSEEIQPIPAPPPEVVAEARLDALWELHTYAAPAPKTTASGFGGADGLSGDIAVGLSVPTTVKPFSQVNPMLAAAQTA